ncbi:glycosyltransferase family 4 protein [bacterium]|nr:glycosyltransferase family 4 protein [bacterium]
MKILCIFPDFYPSIGGMEVFNFKISTFLSQRNEILILTKQIEGCKETDQKILRLLTTNFFLRDLKQILSTINKIKPQVIFVTNAGFSIISKLTKIPVVCRTAGNDFLRSWYGPKIPFWEIFYFHFKIFPLNKVYNNNSKVKFRSYFAKNGLKSCKKIISNSVFVAEKLKLIGVENNKIHVVSGGTDTKQFFPTNKNALKERLKISKDKIIISTIAHLKTEKGLDVALKTISLLIKKVPNILYLIVGEGKERAFLQKEAANLGLEKSVVFIGEIPSNQIQEFLQISDVYLQPSKIETMGRAICEANACGIPVVASNIGGIPSVIQNNQSGLLVEEGDFEEFAKAIQKILADEKLKEKLIFNGLKNADEKFSWEVVGEKIETILMESIN